MTQELKSDAISILFIDGNHLDREYYARRLRTTLPDCNVIQAATGRFGLDLCAKQEIDCVILEIDLPDMSGFEVLVKLVPRAHRPEIPVIILTGQSNELLLEVAVKTGAQAALHKDMTCGDTLYAVILKAISTLRKEKAHPH